MKVKKYMNVRVCKKTFTNNGLLVIHQRKHPEEKRYERDLCGKRFAISRSLSRHKQAHIGEEPYQCEFCKKHFTTLHELLITHNEVLTPVVKTCKIDNRLNILISSSVFMKFYQHIKFYLL